MKLLMEPIDVSLTRNLPSIICWRGGTYDVEKVIDTWSSRGPWWGRDERRRYLLLMTTSGVMEIFHSNLSGWMLSRIFD